jgi:hypothetical protein
MTALFSMHDILELKSDQNSTVDSEEINITISMPIIEDKPIKYKLCKKVCRRSHCKENCADPHNLAQLLKGEILT